MHCYAGSGVTVHLAGHASGRVALTDIHDGLVANALTGLEAGAFVACHVLPGVLLCARGGPLLQPTHCLPIQPHIQMWCMLPGMA